MFFFSFPFNIISSLRSKKKEEENNGSFSTNLKYTSWETDWKIFLEKIDRNSKPIHCIAYVTHEKFYDARLDKEQSQDFT